MSTKVYEAYKIPQEKLKEFSIDVFNQYKKQTQERIANIIRAVKIDKFYKYAIAKNDGIDNVSQDAMSFVFIEWLEEELFLPAAKSNKKSFFDVNYGMWVYPYKKYFLAIPQKPQWLWYDLVSYTNEVDYVEDFSYWNNSDKPDEVSNRDWNTRGKVWDYVFGNSVCLYLAGLDASKKFDLWDFICEIIFTYDIYDEGDSSRT